MRSEKENTFGNYEFDSWVPKATVNLIRGFYGIFGRTYIDWLNNSDSTETCNHGPGPNGFGNPPYGATCDYLIRCYESSEAAKEDRFKVVRGRYIHHWNNIGSIVDSSGKSHHVSSCDRWIRVWQESEVNS